MNTPSEQNGQGKVLDTLRTKVAATRDPEQRSTLMYAARVIGALPEDRRDDRTVLAGYLAASLNATPEDLTYIFAAAQHGALLDDAGKPSLSVEAAEQEYAARALSLGEGIWVWCSQGPYALQSDRLVEPDANWRVSTSTVEDPIEHIRTYLDTFYTPARILAKTRIASTCAQETAQYAMEGKVLLEGSLPTMDTRLIEVLFPTAYGCQGKPIAIEFSNQPMSTGIATAENDPGQRVTGYRSATPGINRPEFASTTTAPRFIDCYSQREIDTRIREYNADLRTRLHLQTAPVYSEALPYQ